MDKAITVNQKEYAVVKLLGKGKGGYSYLVSADDKQYVLKQIHHEPCDYYQFGDKLASEIADYEKLRTIGIPMPQLIEVDKSNERILKEYIHGDTVFEMVLNDALPHTCVEQIKNMCALLYPANTNIDYFPTNFVLQGDILYYIDYECNDYTEQWNYENWGMKYWSKTPEFTQYVSQHCK